MTEDERIILVAIAAGLCGYWFARNRAACACQAKAATAQAAEPTALQWLMNWQGMQ